MAGKAKTNFMNGKQSRKLRSLAALFFQAQPFNQNKKSLKTIYKELKQVHNEKSKTKTKK